MLDPGQTQAYRSQLEAIEDAPQWRDPVTSAVVFENANFVVPLIDEVTRLPAVLAPVKAVLGPDVLVWGASPLTKEPATQNFVSWHQNLTYWNLSGTGEVTAWIALSPATTESGCMRFVPGTHTEEIVEHRDTFEASNMLSRGQEIADSINEAAAVGVVLRPGQRSLHHGRMFHASYANRSEDRRIAMTVRYTTPDMCQLSGSGPARL